MAKFGNDQRAAESGREPGPDALPSPAGGRYDIRIGRDGTWYYQGSAIRRPALVKLFASVLACDDSGDYWLATPAERGRITVDDAPFVAVALDVTGSGPEQSLHFRTNLDHQVVAGPAHPIRVQFSAGAEEPSPYILISRRLDALIVRAVYYRLADLAVEHDGRLGVWSRHRFFPLDAPADAAGRQDGP